VERPKVGQDSVFVLQPQDVVLETFVDETVAVHLGTGRYFSIDLIGTEIINLLETGSSLGAIVDHLSTRYGADPKLVEGAVDEFVGQLLDEELVHPAPHASSSAAIPAAVRADVEFTLPTLSVYSDMEDLLLLDPIHDVDETGWPTRAEPTAGDVSAPLDAE
jgi:hypothetical protein